MHSSLDFPQIHFITRPLFRQRLPEQDIMPAAFVIIKMYPHLRNGDTSDEDKRTLKAHIAPSCLIFVLAFFIVASNCLVAMNFYFTGSAFDAILAGINQLGTADCVRTEYYTHLCSSADLSAPIQRPMYP